MTRVAHFLKPNKGCEVPSQAFWVDTETDPKPIDDHGVQHILRFGWAAYRRRLRGGAWSDPEWLRFTDSDTLWGWVNDHIRPRTKADLYVHNTSFDLPVLRAFAALPSLGWGLRTAIIDAPPTVLTYRSEQRTLRVLDTLNLWRMPLAAVGDMVGVPKLPMPDASASADSWDRYGQNDVSVIMAACLQWWGTLVDDDLGGFAMTLAGQSLRTYRHKYMEHPIYVDTDTRALELARASYCGGRVECRKLGPISGPLYLLDVNSMYPAVMQEMEYPTQLVSVCRHLDVSDLRIQSATRCLVSDVELETPEPVYPIKHGGKLIFPVGTFRTTLTTPEVLYAVEHGHIRRVRDTALYQRAPIFRRFVQDMYARRLAAKAAGDHARDMVYKLLCNSLYGKFGQRGQRWEPAGETPDWTAKVWDEITVENPDVVHYRQFGGLIQRRYDDAESTQSHPAIAAHVTAHARQRLWTFITTAGDGHVYYYDTDSLLVDTVGYARLAAHIDPTRLGALKLEGEFTDAEIWGPKDYRMGAKRRHKGVRASAVWDTDHSVLQDRWSSLRGQLRRGTLDQATTYRVAKTLRREYTKGLVGGDGWVSPLRLPVA